MKQSEMIPFAVFFCLFFIAIDGNSTEMDCSYQRLLKHLNLTRNNDLFLITRPVKNYKTPTNVSLEVALYAILDVVEKDQKFVSYVLTDVSWNNEFLSWDPDDFCGIDRVIVPTDILWKPDITIEEMTERDRATPIHFFTVFSNGTVLAQNDQVLVSTCKMNIYQFPFDDQSCNLSFLSIVYPATELVLQPVDNSIEATEGSRDAMPTQSEWLFKNMTVTTRYGQIGGHYIVTYTITMKRRSVLYVLNFLIPVLMFLILDVATFMVSDTSGEKLGFQITVLLAVTVLQLILNEILPASSNHIPLIALYCIGIFGMMMLSLLKTIIVMYLIQKDSQVDDTNTDSNLHDNESILSSNDVHNSLKTASGNLSELHLISKQVTSVERLEETCILRQILEELKIIDKTLSRQFNTKGKKPKGYWASVAKKVNLYFLICYVSAIVLFLFGLSLAWSAP